MYTVYDLVRGNLPSVMIIDSDVIFVARKDIAVYSSKLVWLRY